ncbi:MAG: ornithine carbamoyltransferase, partial [Gammaproteobacteria bacterium]|nr:ornithine carbamoyltransferase [Gammaproteobacteria bacterium]
MVNVRHFLTLCDFTPAELAFLMRRASELKAMHQRGERHEPLKGKVLGMIFEKSSTRTRVSFEAGMVQFGGAAIFLSPRDTQLGRGEPIEDAARVLSRMVDVITIRTFEHNKVELFARYSKVPVINALTDLHHPCQLLADIQTFIEHRGPIQGRTVAWVGDGNNMCHSFIHAAKQFDFKLRIATPPGFMPDTAIVKAAAAHVEVMEDPMRAAKDADLVATDVWASMGQEDQQATRAQAFQAYQVNADLMRKAQPDALFMHCLPAHRDEEVTAEVL